LVSSYHITINELFGIGTKLILTIIEDQNIGPLAQVPFGNIKLGAVPKRRNRLLEHDLHFVGEREVTFYHGKLAHG